MFQFLNRTSVSTCPILLLLVTLQVAGCSSAEQRAQSYYDHGTKLLAAHNTQGAALEFKNAIRLKKDFLPAWRGLAQIEETDHHWAQLVPVLRTIVELDPKDADSKLKLARLLLYGGAADQALKLASDLDETGNANVLALKAEIFYKLKDSSGAVREAQAALKIDPSNVGAMMVLAADRLDNGDPKAALQILDSDPVAHANDLGVQLFKIKIFEQLGDQPQIESQLQKLVALYPQEPAFRQQLVKFYIGQHRSNDAENELRAIAAADPKNTGAVLDLVRFLYATKSLAAARTELTTRISAGGDVFAYQMALAELDFAQGNSTDSFKLLETLASSSSSSDQAETAKMKLAEFNFEKKNVDAADALVADILHNDSRNIGALRLRAQIRMDRGQFDPAISDIREALNDQPRSTDLMLLLATAYERSGSIELAEKQFADAMKVSDYDPNVGLNYVAFLRRRGSVQRAGDVLADLAGHRPNNVAILSTLAEVKLQLQDWAGAQEVGDAIRRIGGSNGIADQIFGAALGGEKKFDASISAFQAAVTDAPTAVQPMVLLVRELVSTKQTDRAITFLQTVLKTNPANAEALVLLGSVQLVNNAPDQAMKSFTAAIQAQPKDPAGYRAVADLYLSQHNKDAALQTIQSGLKQRPDNIALHMSSASILELQGNYDGAISEYEYVLNQQPGAMVAANNLASLLSDHRSDKASIDRAQTLAVMLRKSQVPQFKDTLGWISYRQGDLNAAVPQLQDAATALPDVALIHYHLGMAYLGVGQNAKASDEFKIALTKAPNDDLAETIRTELKKITTQ
jgi:tetratricopeptide (TPR) repeat protein